MKKNKHIGSDFDAWLEEEGILEEVELLAIQKIIRTLPSAPYDAYNHRFLIIF